MKYTISCQATKEADGYDETIVITRDEVDDLYDVVDFLSSAVQSFGYNYATYVEVHTDNGKTYSSDW